MLGPISVLGDFGEQCHGCLPSFEGVGVLLSRHFHLPLVLAPQIPVLLGMSLFEIYSVAAIPVEV